MNDRPLRTDDRGVSTTVSYTMAMGITVVLVGGLVFSFGGFMDGNIDQATDSELRVLSEGVATELTKVDTIIERADGTGTHATLLTLPPGVAGSSYTITAVDDPCPFGQGLNSCVIVETDSRVQHVPVDLSHAVSGTVDGGELWIVAEAGEIELREERPS